MEPEFLTRGVNDGFSGGEKKRNEVLQMLILEPTFADDGRDRLGSGHRRVEGRRARVSTRCAVPTAASWSSRTTSACWSTSCPDFVHVLADGRIVRSGDKSLALELEEKGYSWIESGLEPEVATGS